MLVIITGPVGAGKSTLAHALAELLRRQSSVKVAVIDLDIVYGMVRQKKGFAEQELWPLARRASAALAARFLKEDFDSVVLEGEFFSPQHFEQLRSGAPDLPRWTTFVLSVSYAEALRRVRLDSSRGESKDPAILRRFHEAFVAALPFLNQKATVLDAERLEPGDLASQIAAHLARHVKLTH